MSRIMQDVPKLDNYYNEVADTPTSPGRSFIFIKVGYPWATQQGACNWKLQGDVIVGAIIIYYTERHELREPFVFINVNSYYLGD